MITRLTPIVFGVRNYCTLGFELATCSAVDALVTGTWRFGRCARAPVCLVGAGRRRRLSGLFCQVSRWLIIVLFTTLGGQSWSLSRHG